jgi:hypothetical protein
MWTTKNLKLLTCYSPVCGWGSCSALLCPVVHNQLLCLADIEGEVVVLAPHCQVSDLLPIIIFSDQANHRCVVSTLDGVGVVHSHAVVGKQRVQEGTKHASLRVPMLRVSVTDEKVNKGKIFFDIFFKCVVTYPHHLGWPIRKSRIQLPREVFSPRVLSLVL